MKKEYIRALVIINIIIVAISSLYIVYTRVSLELIGDNDIDVTINTVYQDEGIIVKLNGKELSKDKYTLKVKDYVVSSVLGDYVIKYEVKYHIFKYYKKRTVHVVDNLKPEITINVDSVEKNYCNNQIITNYLYSSIDNYDGDITKNVIVSENEEELLFISEDSSGNINKVSIPITLINNDTILSINGNSTIYIKVGDTYNDAGATYTDECNHDLSDLIVTTGSVDTSTVGTYYINYKVDDKVVSRTVVVEDYPRGNGKILYLTFDDGPGIYTESILNTLAKYNVKATFFVTHQFGDYIHLIGREYNEGHAIGVHSYTHNWNIYSSLDSYMSDFDKMNKDIINYTGSPSSIFRFPGGSSNTVSRNYSTGIVSSIASYMNSIGYVYFDWDVDSGDASGASSSSIYNNVVNGASWCNQCVFLMHDIKYNTAIELDSILDTLTKRGYQFGTLNHSSPTAHHRIVN